MSRPSETISARFDNETLKALDEARRPFGDSRGEFMRRMILAQLQRDEGQWLRDELGEIRASSAEMETQLSDMITSLKKLSLLLLSLDRPVDLSQARKMVQRVFPDRDQE